MPFFPVLTEKEMNMFKKYLFFKFITKIITGKMIDNNKLISFPRKQCFRKRS